MNERTVFMTALEKEDPAQRKEYLNEACAGDPALRDRVEALLRAHEREGKFLDVPAAEQLAQRGLKPEEESAPAGGGCEEACGNAAVLRARVEELLSARQEAGNFQGRSNQPEATKLDPMAECSGAIIGPYRLLEQIGEGGFGIVFMAEQQEPIRRKVAFKILKPGMDTRQVIARFEAERQALALMDHPHIAKVLDAGQTTNGRPYFVMDLVKGLAITEYCEEGQLALKERRLSLGRIKAIWKRRPSRHK